MTKLLFFFCSFATFLISAVKGLCAPEQNILAFYDAFYPWTSCSFLHFISSFQRKWKSSEDIIGWPQTHPGSTRLRRDCHSNNTRAELCGRSLHFSYLLVMDGMKYFLSSATTSNNSHRMNI